MALPVTIPNTFANATSSIPLSQLDTNFSTLANAVNGISSGSETLANVIATNLTVTNDATINGVRVGEGAGSVATNTALGASALAANTTGANNVAIGAGALDVNTTGDRNTAVGKDALGANTTGRFNTAFGYEALLSSTASGLTAVGYDALANNTTGANNVAVGFEALVANTTGANNTAVGYAALDANTTGIDNTAVGQNSLTASTTGSYNTGIGRSAMEANTTGERNTSIGRTALQNNTTGSYNTALGMSALEVNTTGSYNTAVGYQAGYANTTANNGTFIGLQAGYASTGANNTFVGTVSGSEVTTGAKNTILGTYNGNQNGLDIRTSNNHIVLSDGDGNPRFIVDAQGDISIGGNPGAFWGSATRLAVNANADAYGFAIVNAGDNTNRLGIGIAAGTYDSSGTSTMISFNDGDGNGVGSITNAGGTVSYNAFLGAHYTEVQGETVALLGTVYESIDALVENQYSSQDRLPKVKISDTVESTSVYGVYLGDSDWNVEAKGPTGILVASVGAGWVRIAQGVTVQRGDLLVSNGDGCAKVQSDDIVRSKTIGKVVSTTVVDTYPDGSYLVPVVLYCG